MYSSIQALTRQLLLLCFIVSLMFIGGCTESSSSASAESETNNSAAPITESMAIDASQIDTLGMDISDAEKEAIAKAMHYGRQISRMAEKQNGLPYRRDAHAKATACVRATFTVKDDIAPQFLHSALHKPGVEFQAWIRFSNGDMTVQADSKPDARGMAIRVMNVPGEKIAPELPESAIQDFVMTNMPVFFHRNVFDYVDDMYYLAKLERTRWFISLWPPRIHPKRLYIAKQTVSSRIKSPLQPQYYSMTPYQLGTTTLKFSAKPCAGMTFNEAVDTSNYDFLTQAMQAKLDHSAACFDFMVQERRADKDMPIDDATVEWSEQESPFITVATINIPPQSFASEEQQLFCENLSMNPWHGVGEWQPLGSLNRSRRLVYHAVSQFRHEQNDAQVSDPNNWCLERDSECDVSQTIHQGDK